MNYQKQTSEIVLIVNPNSSGGSTGKNWDNLYNQVRQIIGGYPEVAFSKKPGDGTTLARDFLRKGFKKVVALGGDGTINEVANGFFEEIILENYDNTNSNAALLPMLRAINPDAMMGLIPIGSRNVLAKSLDLPDGIVECCQRFVNTKPQKIDVIAVSISKVREDPSTEANNHKIKVRIFLNAAEIGVGAEIINRSKKIRDRIKSRFISTISSVIATVPAYESNLCEVSIDDGKKSLLSKMTMGVIANGRYLGGGFRAAPRANISDGLLDITILKNSGSFKMLEGFVNMKGDDKDYTQDNNDIFYYQAKKVFIKSKEKDIMVTLDGEPAGVLPATFRVYPDALNVIF
jgi:diacylglycerol kinase family enzyme